MRIGVIGGSGFIGTHLVDRLMTLGHEVTVFDIMRPSRSDVRHIVIDITDLSKTTVALTGGYDVVFLLAAVANVNDVFHIPVESATVNIIGTANVLEAARRVGVGRVVYASTTWVYGLAAEVSCTEETPLRPQSAEHVYAATKLSAEMLCHSYRRLYGQDSTILRYGIPYGPGARAGTVLAAFVSRALAGQPLSIDGDGQQWRRFVYIDDLVEGNVLALQPEARDQVYNLEGDERVTVRQVAESVQMAFPQTEVIYRDRRPGDMAVKDVSNAKAKAELGWSPQVPFAEGASAYIRWAIAEGTRSRPKPAKAAARAVAKTSAVAS